MVKTMAEEYISLKCTYPDTVHKVLDKEIRITVNDIYTLPDKLTLNKMVFLTLGGDIGRAEVDWEPGFRAIAHVIKPPYDRGYRQEKKYFKIDLAIDLLLPIPMVRADFVHYRNAYNAAYIGPELNRDPSQAVSTLMAEKAVAVVRCALEKFPMIKDRLEQIFDKEFLAKVYGPQKIFMPLMLKYGEDPAEAFQQQINQVQNKDNYVVSSSTIFPPLNLLLYGVPGCGKSHYVATNYEAKLADSQHVYRVVFHPDYTFSDFIGQILPQVNADNKVEYKFTTGPFTSVLKAANANPNEQFLFIIEELNRGNAPAIFGEVFQLLDRDETGVSKYGIYNKDMAEVIYGAEAGENREIKIPANLAIIATMNTADQNVFTMDTAFQRRWHMKHIPNKFAGGTLDDNTKAHVAKLIPGSNISWGVFAQTVNAGLAQNNYGLPSNEDKSLGVYFATDKELDDREAFAEKVLKYLWDDAFKLNRDKLFKDKDKSLSDIIEAFEEAADDSLLAVLLPDDYKKMLQQMPKTSGAEADEAQSEI